MSGALQHYRLSLLGQDLLETLDELIANEMLDEDLKDCVLDNFGKAMTEALSGIKSRVTIKGVMAHYRNHDDIWRIFLKNIDMKIDGKGVESNAMTEMIAVSKR